MKSEVITVSSYDPKPAYYRPNAFRASLAKFGVAPVNLGEGEAWNGLMTKPRLYRKFLREGRQQGDVLIVCDAWDVFFQAHPDELVDVYLHEWQNGTMVFNAERNCFPCSEPVKARFDELAEFFWVKTPWRYLNSGFLVGRPTQILQLLESMDLDSIPDDYQRPDGSWFNPNDQEQFQLAFARTDTVLSMELDYDTELCLAAHGSTMDELDFSGPRIKNKITGSTPLALHCNGSAKNDLAPKILEHLGLPQK
jgi:hypothetical protein